MDPFEKEFRELADKTETVGYSFEKCATRMDPEGPFHWEDVAMALVVFRGNFSRASQALGRRRNSLKRFVDGHEFLAELRAEIIEGLLDDVEDVVFTGARSGDFSTARWLLKELGHTRGYGENRSEGNDVAVPLNIVFNGREPVGDIRVTRGDEGNA
jgi:hypothetical protein